MKLGSQRCVSACKMRYESIQTPPGAQNHRICFFLSIWGSRGVRAENYTYKLPIYRLGRPVCYINSRSTALSGLYVISECWQSCGQLPYSSRYLLLPPGWLRCCQKPAAAVPGHAVETTVISPCGATPHPVFGPLPQYLK